MVLNRIQYKNINNEELIQELNDINSSFFNDINGKLTNLRENFKNYFLSCSNVKAETLICSPGSFSWITLHVANSQYSSRETIELNPVSAKVKMFCRKVLLRRCR